MNLNKGMGKVEHTMPSDWRSALYGFMDNGPTAFIAKLALFIF